MVLEVGKDRRPQTWLSSSTSYGVMISIPSETAQIEIAIFLRD
jgi:hypothetical protein